jgi:RNA polymerase sigma-70 factor (ECF subfamily)
LNFVLAFPAIGNKTCIVSHSIPRGEKIPGQASQSLKLPIDGGDQPANDLELARAAGRGDAQAFHVLVDRYSADLFRIALSMSSSRADAEDVRQVKLVGAFRGIARFDGRSSVKTWLTRILLRQAAKIWRQNKRRATLSIDQRRRSSNGSEDMPAIELQAAAVDRDTSMDLMDKIATLAADHRQVILLREVHGMSYDEIAQSLGIPRGTVESRLFRARAELRRRLKHYEI